MLEWESLRSSGVTPGVQLLFRPTTGHSRASSAGKARSLAGLTGRLYRCSRCIFERFPQIPKLTVRVRFPSSAPNVMSQDIEDTPNPHWFGVFLVGGRVTATGGAPSPVLDVLRLDSVLPGEAAITRTMAHTPAEVANRHCGASPATSGIDIAAALPAGDWLIRCDSVLICSGFFRQASDTARTRWTKRARG